MQKKILLIEDDKDVLFLIKTHLCDAGYSVEAMSDGMKGLARCAAAECDLIILDVMLPGMDGISVCREVRARKRYVPIFMVTARTSEIDRILGLEMGADDYLTKPFSILELLARVKALFRRMDALTEQVADARETAVIHRQGLELDKGRHKVSLNDNSLELTPREFDLLYHFASNPGRVFSRAQLLDDVWGYGFEGYEQTVNSHINRLRAKIEHDPSNPAFIQTPPNALPPLQTLQNAVRSANRNKTGLRSRSSAG